MKCKHVSKIFVNKTERIVLRITLKLKLRSFVKNFKITNFIKMKTNIFNS